MAPAGAAAAHTTINERAKRLTNQAGKREDEIGG
jgi:hypothetical protein